MAFNDLLTKLCGGREPELLEMLQALSTACNTIHRKFIESRK